MATHLQRAYPPSRPEPGQAYWLPFQAGELLVQEHEATPALLQGDEMEFAALLGQTPLYLGVLDGVAYLASEVSAEWSLPAGWRRQELRGLFGLLDERIYGLVGYAWQILCWRRESGYCPRCGRPLGELSTQWARHCTNCCYIGGKYIQQRASCNSKSAVAPGS